ncbi:MULTISPECIES: tRNA lysidine(34) synthetase TilS [Mycolicibacter]|uniref:tRNA(Ile)-lysidine synthase n=1 Tax=Mycolicibacter virginiensis TaxID=1795032 RepID=A0A9X7IP42_9MYCO|nr:MULTISPECIES: tRNA lysidine(34) synthetase TilS [Mycobacteriaceae]OBG38392.1 tRNA lysidine(34) synthetase TilS [Mycolicibacter heraklionensis]PQM52573.1 tRNA lysidine(34) synthetase TilS [Mycolicibacter virginiensis]ULP47252.1 tRNA lysidine(34) synthetase TilS [Mycolicibacter virginiensis]
MDRPGAVAALRAALGAFAEQFLPQRGRWAVALSGGPDSLALTAVAAAMRPTTALIVDHGLQAGSAQVAKTAYRQALDLGCVDAQVIPVTVGVAGGPEAAARTARYAALAEARGRDPVLLGHTLDDQAETVLLGLGRGSGARSMAGMRPYDPPWCRPLLGVRRAQTAQACTELGLTPWLDPHNSDGRFTRVRLRAEVLPLLEDVLGGGVAEALARTAIALRENTELIDGLAEQALSGATTGAALDAAALATLAGPVRLAVIRRWLIDGGGRGLTDLQIRAVDRLVTAWRGQGGVAIGSDLRGQRLFAVRGDGLLRLRSEPV